MAADEPAPQSELAATGSSDGPDGRGSSGSSEDSGSSAELQQAIRRHDGRRLRQAEQLAGTLAQVGAAPTLEDALQALVLGALSLLDGEHGLARLFDLNVPVGQEGGTTLYVEAYADGRLQVRRRPRGHLQPGNFGALLREGGPPVLVEDFWTLDPLTYPAYEMMRRQGMRAAVNVPIDAAGRRIGSLHVDHTQPGYFDAADLAAAGALALQAGATIERARLEGERAETQRQLDAQTAQLALREAETAALRELDRLKAEFIRSISHELRTPLTVVHGYAQQLHAKAASLDSAAVQRRAETLLQASTRLTKLLTDLLDFTRIDAGEIEVREEPVDLALLLSELVDDLRDSPGGERLQCEVQGRPVALADRAQTRHAITNLVDNALKYAPDGAVVMRAYASAPPATDDSDHAAHHAGAVSKTSKAENTTEPMALASGLPVVRVEVEDRGPGIPRRERRRVWESFYRGEAVAGLNIVPGSGVGLTVAKALVEVQGGRIGLETPPAGGCLAWIELPAHDTRPAE
ncbi:MAG: hypothetical protein AVDCRST_MAG77-3045 [uncultured Chloroflexi bacterium]|uniref:histidine kinase n=1 Tax=uncultured Chloroflexota bacterium TaxID=166587 RepID=A0A6J4J257_9CHLR|nr:MAG: hypothetical protein AVDCRST_MAG77-3045 [uncultured Chloroflexota bacterium]